MKRLLLTLAAVAMLLAVAIPALANGDHIVYGLETDDSFALHEHGLDCGANEQVLARLRFRVNQHNSNDPAYGRIYDATVTAWYAIASPPFETSVTKTKDPGQTIDDSDGWKNAVTIRTPVGADMTYMTVSGWADTWTLNGNSDIDAKANRRCD